jgi:hypothetical protein
VPKPSDDFPEQLTRDAVIPPMIKKLKITIEDDPMAIKLLLGTWKVPMLKGEIFDLELSGFTFKKCAAYSCTVNPYCKSEQELEIVYNYESVIPTLPPKLVAWQYKSHHASNTVKPGWSQWEFCDEAKFNEINEYISTGYRYKTRTLYSDPLS